MAKFEIIEFDRDYRTVTGVEHMEFPSKEDADAWCRKESWTGYDYHARSLEPSVYAAKAEALITLNSKAL